MADKTQFGLRKRWVVPPTRGRNACGHALAHLGCIHADPKAPGEPGPRYCAAPDLVRKNCKYSPEQK